MYEKVNPCHPDKVADRIAGAIVDLAYQAEPNPKVAVEVLIGHGKCHAIIETTATIDKRAIDDAVHRIAGEVEAENRLAQRKQDEAERERDAAIKDISRLYWTRRGLPQEGEG